MEVVRNPLGFGKKKKINSSSLSCSLAVLRLPHKGRILDVCEWERGGRGRGGGSGEAGVGGGLQQAG